jgi:hypothetical protein
LALFLLGSFVQCLRCACPLFVVGGEVRCVTVIILLSVAFFRVVRLLAMLSSVLPGDCSAEAAGCSTVSIASTVVAVHCCLCPAHVIRGNECVVVGSVIFVG